MKISIVTINYNDAIGLKKTLESVAKQKTCDCEVEHIVVDGGSTDNSVEIIKQYPHVTKWISEKDKGVYNAMNKGIEIALGRRKVNDFNRSELVEDKHAQRLTEGENKGGSSETEHYIQILNSGDILASDHVIVDCRLKIEELGYPELMYGNMLRQRLDGTIEGKSGQVPYSLLNYFTATMNHDCCWIKRSLFDEYGLYDENLKIVSDWKWFLQAIGLGHVKPVYVDIDMTIFDTTGISERNLELRNEERRKVLEEVLPSAVLGDYDNYAFPMHQIDRLKKHHFYGVVYFIERVLFKLEKWGILK